ncbi:UNVERIFIED_CONTAM: Callose synthase 11 [Sesamum radiatum]|uniref:Callose synthase 11 n=1 Tax=Sesamum radiatum TaxID=300843 RepID=A0AAW2KHI6_SESRA
MLRSPNEDGVSTLFYLQKIYADEWANFMERMHKEGMQDDSEIWTTKTRDLRLWASYRDRHCLVLDGYTRSQDVSSLGSLKQNSGINSQGITPPIARNLNRAGSSVSLLFKGHEFGVALMKYTYVVACQMYGVHKGKGDPRAEEILYLMKNNEALRVAYVDEVYLGREEVEYYSVLVKYDQQQQKEVEIYRIKLPGPLKLGEGKPENQNHAIIFTRGDALQAIDMNQDNYFEEALKMRNLLEEFKVNYGIRKPTILGVRENIFTGSVSSLAWFMSAQEMSFVTLGQRVLANPLKVRMHYGHPDVFDSGLLLQHMMVVVMVYTFLWGRLYLALSGVEDYARSANNNRALGSILNQQFIIQIGVFTALPMIVENSLEHGFLPAVWDFITMQLELASVFILSQWEHVRISLAICPQPFVKAIELGVILIVYASNSPLATNTFVYIAMTISSWFLVVSWIMSPFVFNPSGFDWLKTVYDFDDFMNWIWYRGILVKADQSWETWWYEEQDHFRTTGLWGKLLEIILDLRFFFFQYGIVYHLNIASGNRSIVVYLLSWIYLIVAVGIYIVMAYARDKYAANEHIYYRLVQFLVISSVVWETVVSLARLYDMIFGLIVMAPLAFLSWMPGFQQMQTRILFNEAFSRGLQISRILTGKKSNVDT